MNYFFIIIYKIGWFLICFVFFLNQIVNIIGNNQNSAGKIININFLFGIKSAAQINNHK